MFTHIVLFKLKENTKENRELLASILRGMEGKIDLLRGIEVGIDELNSERSYQVSLITRFDSFEDMDAYQIHPYHVNEVVAKIKSLIECSKTVDYQS